MDCLRSFDPEMADLACAEYQRQLNTLNLIVSENYASPYALALEGSILANKNAGGYPDSRGVGGCQVVNAIENLAIERIKQLFGCDHVNLQSMSATIANGSPGLAPAGRYHPGAGDRAGRPHEPWSRRESLRHDLSGGDLRI